MYPTAVSTMSHFVTPPRGLTGKDWLRITLAVAVLAAILGAPSADAHDPVPGTRIEPLKGDGDWTYVYAPSVWFENGVYSWWTCRGRIFGDHVVYHQSQLPRFVANWGWLALGPTNLLGSSDGAHTCDPSAIRVPGGWVVCYFTGFPRSDSTLPKTSTVGVAGSVDNGRTFFRLPGIGPIIQPANPAAAGYGAGQPTAFYDPATGWVYLAFHDSTAPASNPVTGGGIYVIRSKDAFFSSGTVQELVGPGRWADRPSTAALTREYAVLDAIGVDMALVTQNDSIVVALNGAVGRSSFRFFSKDFEPKPEHDLDLDLEEGWREGPALLRTPDGHILPHPTGPNRISLVWFNPTGDLLPWWWKITTEGVDLDLTPDAPAEPNPAGGKWSYRTSFEEDAPGRPNSIAGAGPIFRSADHVMNVVTDPASAFSGDRVLRYEFRKDEEIGYASVINPEGCSELSVKMRIMFPGPSDFPAGGKIGRIGGHEPEEGGFLFQWMIEIRGDINGDPLNPAQRIALAANSPNGRGLAEGPFTPEPGRWYEVEVRAKINTPGRPDGVAEVLIDGRQIAYNPAVQYRAEGEAFLFDRYGLASWYSNGSANSVEPGSADPAFPFVVLIDDIVIQGD